MVRTGQRNRDGEMKEKRPEARKWDGEIKKRTGDRDGRNTSTQTAKI